MPFHKKKGKKPKNIDAFNSKTSTNGQVNDNDPADNILLNPTRKHLLNKKNKAPAATFTKRQKRLQDAINSLDNY